jgi:hypothetical protein
MARDNVGGGGGWLTFAAVMFLLASMLNLIWGAAALANDDYFAADELLFGDLSMWGVFYLVLSAAQLAAGLLIFAGKESGAFIGIVLATLNAVLALVSIGAYPLWSVTLLVLDGLIIYGLTVYGFEERRV